MQNLQYQISKTRAFYILLNCKCDRGVIFSNAIVKNQLVFVYGDLESDTPIKDLLYLWSKMHGFCIFVICKCDKDLIFCNAIVKNLLVLVYCTEPYDKCAISAVTNLL